MRALRLILALIVALYALISLATAGGFAAFRARLYSPPADTPPEMLDLMAATSWPQLAVWLLAVALYLVVAIKLVRRAKTFVFWAAAFLLDMVNWLWSRSSGAYDAAFSPAMQQLDYAIIAANLLIGVLILWLGRTHLD